MNNDTVILSVPAKPDYILAVRLLVAAVAQRANFSFDDIEDIKVASAEACMLLLAESPVNIEVKIIIEESFSIVFSAIQPGKNTAGIESTSELSRYLLEALVDRCEMQSSEGILNSITIYKD